jgi:hypothetical protein
MSKDMMPKRWGVGNYDGYMVERDGGDYVEAEDVEPLVAEITRLRAEVMEQARLLGMGSEREAKLRARIKILEKALRYYADEAYNGYNANGGCARAALEAKP